MTPGRTFRDFVPLVELPGFDPVGLRVHGAEFPTSPFGLAVDASGDVVHVLEAITTVRHHARTLSVSLADAATRDRLARFVAARVGLECGATAPAVRLSGWDHHDGTKTRSFWLGDSDWSISGAELPALLDLVDNDDTRLPDGCRSVDAEALAIVARHVAASVQR